uniref:Histone deacetylase complex subunit SAP30 n=1 Tax=Lygus hesperus TaxID=30085 RepID=A0A0A9WA87_LYGHE
MQREAANNGFSTGEEDSRGPPDQVCCLIDDNYRCTRPAGNASYSKRIQKTVTQKKLRLNLDPSAPNLYICDHHKGVIQTARSKRRRKDSEDDSNEPDPDIPEVDLGQLQVSTLRKYKRHFKVTTRPSLNKAQLAELLLKHFKNLPVDEKDIISNFYYITSKPNKSKTESKNGPDVI